MKVSLEVIDLKCFIDLFFICLLIQFCNINFLKFDCI